MTSLYNQDEDGAYRAALTQQSNYWRDMYHDEVDAHHERHERRRPDWIMRGYLAIVATIVLAGVFSLGYLVGKPDGPACTSATEDSQILDCDYRDGGWYPK